MAERRSTYLIEKEDDFNDLKDHLYREMSSDYNNSNAVYFYGYWGGCSQFGWNTCYRIDIYSECSDVPRVTDIIREHRGRYYDM